jgi:hypothetical protein
VTVNVIQDSQYCTWQWQSMSSMTANTAPDDDSHCHPWQPILHLTLAVTVIHDWQTYIYAFHHKTRNYTYTWKISHIVWGATNRT